MIDIDSSSCSSNNSNSNNNKKRNSSSSAYLALQQKRKSAKGSSNFKRTSPTSEDRPVALISNELESTINDNRRRFKGETRKQNHSEIEKRRRDKMNQYIVELASVIPSFANNKSKFDKLTVLRMAIQHVKSLRSSLCSFSSFHLRPSFLSSGNLLKNLILQMASQESQDNLFMVVTCDHGKVLFVSQSSKNILNQDQNELVGQCLFDLLHKDDVSKVKEQISYINLMPKEMLVDSKTLQPIRYNEHQSFNQSKHQSSSTPQPGARRSFFCRMKSGRSEVSSSFNVNENNSTSKETTNSSMMMTPPPASSSSSTGVNRSANMANSQNQELVDGYTIKQTITSDQAGDNGDNSSIRAPENRSLTQSDQTFSLSHEQATVSAYQTNSKLNSNPAEFTSASKTNTFASNEDDNIKSRNERVQTNSNLKNTHNSIRNCTRNKIGRFHKSLNRHNSRSASKLASNHSSSGISSNGSAASLDSRGSRTSGSSSDSNSSTSSVSNITSATQTNNQSSGNESSQSNKTNCVLQERISQTKMANTNINRRYLKASSSKKHLPCNVMHCTGYLKSITLRSDEIDDEDFDELYRENNNSSEDDENDSCRTVNCLVAVFRRSPMDTYLKPDRPLTFTCRYSMEGKFVFADQRTTMALGYTPQQLLGTSHYAYCQKDSVNTFKECHRQSILKSEPVSSDIYQFKRANGQYLWLQTSLKSFRNPWTKFIDYIVANHTTAEGNDPYYNEGCVPTKFNQDMTSYSSQSSSPASTSSIPSSLPSTDSKKSSSPGSSIGSSYSMESFASGGNIQALLNQIDRVKSGGPRYPLDFLKRKGNMHIPRSDGGSSARKSTEDNGNYSDIQSCSSLSSNVSNDYMSRNQNVDNFVDNQIDAGNQASASVSSNAIATRDTFYNQRTNVFGNTQGSFGIVDYQQTASSQQAIMARTSTNASSFKYENTSTNSTEVIGRYMKSASKVSRKLLKPQGNPPVKYQRHHTMNPLYYYRDLQNKSSTYSSPSSDTGNETATWSNSSGSVYSNSSDHQSTRETVDSTMPNQMTTTVKDRSQSSNRVCNLQIESQTMDKLENRNSPFVMQTIQNMVMAPNQIQMQGPMEEIGSRINQNYSTDLITVNSYVNQEINNRYTDQGVNLEPLQHGLTMNNSDPIQSNMVMTMQPHQLNRSEQSGTTGMPMIWQTADDTYNQNLNTSHNIVDCNPRYCNCSGVEQVCNGRDVTLMNMNAGNSTNQIIAQQTTVHCQQCANHKCSNQQMIISNNADMNSENLTSLLVDGDLDEDQLLEYLSGYDVEAQLYNLENNAFPQQENI